LAVAAVAAIQLVSVPASKAAQAVAPGHPRSPAATGAISGTVTNATTGNGVTGVSVEVLDSSGTLITSTSTSTSGAYTISGLTPSTTGYTVCFQASSASGGGSSDGYQSQCYQWIAWDGFSSPPSGTTPVPLSSGYTASGINGALVPDGGIAGTVN
jgi:hypothetical protein